MADEDTITVNDKGEILLTPDMSELDAALLAATVTGDPKALDKLQALYPQTSHEPNCPYRNKGECDCVKDTIVGVLEHYNREVP